MFLVFPELMLKQEVKHVYLAPLEAIVKKPQKILCSVLQEPQIPWKTLLIVRPALLATLESTAATKDQANAPTATLASSLVIKDRPLAITVRLVDLLWKDNRFASTARLESIL